MEEVLATATKEMERLEKEVNRLKSELEQRNYRSTRLTLLLGTVDQAEAVSAEALELKKQSRMCLRSSCRTLAWF